MPPVCNVLILTSSTKIGNNDEIELWQIFGKHCKYRGGLDYHREKKGLSYGLQYLQKWDKI